MYCPRYELKREEQRRLSCPPFSIYSQLPGSYFCSSSHSTDLQQIGHIQPSTPTPNFRTLIQFALNNYAMPANMGEQAWSISLWDCFNPSELCCKACCVPCVAYGKTQHRMGHNGNLEGYSSCNSSVRPLCESGERSMNISVLTCPACDQCVAF